MCCGSQMEPVDLGDKQEVVSSLDDAGELHTKSDKGEGGVGPYGVRGSLESSGERHTKSDKGDGGVGPYRVTNVGIDNTRDRFSECGRSSTATSEILRLPSSKSQDILGLFSSFFQA